MLSCAALFATMMEILRVSLLADMTSPPLCLLTPTFPLFSPARPLLSPPRCVRSTPRRGRRTT